MSDELIRALRDIAATPPVKMSIWDIASAPTGKHSPWDCAIAAWAADEITRLRAENAKAMELIESAMPYVRAAMHSAEAKHDDPESDTYFMDGVQYEIMCECMQWLDKVAVLRGEVEK